MNVKRRLIAQFAQPHGWLGNVAGMIMATRPSNIERNDWTLSLLDLQPADHILEIGFGPGIAMRKAAETITQGRIVGLDHSDVMLSQASKRNARYLSEGRMILMLGALAALSELAGPFDKIFSVNVFMFWNDPVAVYEALGRLLAPGGVIATTLQPRGSGVTDQNTVQVAEKISGALRDASFSDVRREIRPMKPVSTVCVLASKA